MRTSSLTGTQPGAPSPFASSPDHVARAIDLAQRSPHTFTIQYPPSRAYFRQHFRAPSQGDAATNLSLDVGSQCLLYLHVPFCSQRCFYCNFAVDLRKNEALHARYINALCTQLHRQRSIWDQRRLSLQGIDIGGGTPTLLPLPLLEQLLDALDPWIARQEQRDARASIETTPSVAANEPEKLRLLVAGQIKRVSIGIQSTHDATLASVNRRRQRSLGDDALENLMSAGFERVSVDLVFGLPEQSVAMFLEDIERVLAHDIDAITIYDCLYRGEGRALPGLARSSRPTMPHYATLYDAAYELLISRGYHGRYGGVNFCRHQGTQQEEVGTSDYFTQRLRHGRSYLGLGNYASSLLEDGSWWFAPYEVDDYIEAIEQGAVFPCTDQRYALPASEHAAKVLLANLNFGSIQLNDFKRLFGLNFEDCYPHALRQVLESGWMRYDTTSESLHVMEGAFEHLPTIRALFYSARALQWVETHLDLCSA